MKIQLPKNVKLIAPIDIIERKLVMCAADVIVCRGMRKTVKKAQWKLVDETATVTRETNRTILHVVKCDLIIFELEEQNE